jgi:hypothetical protein
MKRFIRWVQNLVAGNEIEQSFEFGLQLGARSGIRISERMLLDTLDKLPQNKKLTVDEFRAVLKEGYAKSESDVATF